MTLAQMADRYAAEFPVEAPPAGQTPDERIGWLRHERLAQGRTPQQWLDTAHAFTLDLPEATPAPAGDIVGLVGGLYAALGLSYDAAAVTEQVAAMPADLRGPWADLLNVIAGVFPQQQAIAAAVQMRLEKPVDVHTVLVTHAERDLMLANQARIVDAINMFRARTRGLFAVSQTSGPIFSDPEGLVVLGSTGSDTYTRSGTILDPVLLVDPEGNDTYRNTAGGACPLSIGGWLQCNLLPLSVVADISATSRDSYTYNGPVAAVQGAGGPGGLGVLIDVGGNDTYAATMYRTTYPFMSYFDGGAQGFGFGGAGLQLDGTGDDDYTFNVHNQGTGYSIWALAQGFGGAGGVGISSDMGGSDDWISNAVDTGSRGGEFIGVYTDGGGFYGGVGIVSDAGLGDDTWIGTAKAPSTDYYAQGFGAFGGVGILYEDGGDDTYVAYEEATATSPAINPVLNCAFGTASFAGLGLMIDLEGNDDYTGTTKSLRSAYTMDFGFGGPGVAYGAFLDATGNDSYKLSAIKGPGTSNQGFVEGYGYWNASTSNFFDILGFPLGRDTFGAFADLGGNDVYVGGRGRNNDQWPFGVDRGV